jgi:hypothetical protein
MRFRKAREQSVSQFLDGDLRASFVGRLRKVADLGDVVVCDVVEAIQRLGELDITAARRDRLAGFLVFGGRGDYKSSSWFARRAELRELGIAVDPARAGRLVVPVGRHLRVLASMWEAA